MLKQKCSHTLLAFNGRYILSLGGYVERRDSSFCEAYNVEKNKWIQIIPLSEPKAYIIACTFNNRFIYCIGGRGCTQKHTIEILDGLAMEDEWVSVQLMQFDMLTKNNYGEAMQISGETIMILSRNGLFVYNTKKDEFNKRCQVNAEDLGLEIVPVLYKSWMYQIAKRSPKPYIEVYSIIQNTTLSLDIEQPPK